MSLSRDFAEATDLEETTHGLPRPRWLFVMRRDRSACPSLDRREQRTYVEYPWGLLRVSAASLWSNVNADKAWRMQPFGGELSGFRDFGGYRLPTVVDGGNLIGTQANFPFFRARVREIRFDDAGLTPPGAWTGATTAA